MSEQKTVPFAYPRLCFAYFLLFAIWGSWAGALGGYASGVLQLSGIQIGWLYAAIPLGAVISPLFIGPIADRYFAAQKVVAFLHLIGGIALLAAGGICYAGSMTGDSLFYALMALILMSGICFMPTIALVNSIVFKHSKEGTAPYVFVFGTTGWIVINLFIAAFLDGAAKPFFLFAGGTCGLILSVYSLTLPNTPPKGAPQPGEKSDALGLGALKLFKDPGFAFFVFCAFLASIPACNYFFAFQVDYLTQHGYPAPVALQTLNQFSELFFMAMLPFFIGKFGLKWVVALGIGAWSLRYFIFAVPTFDCAIIGLLLHGFGYSFLYVAAYIYADKKAPADLKASVQSLMAFLLLGVGQTLGSLSYGIVRDMPVNAQPALSSQVLKDVQWVVPVKDGKGEIVPDKFSTAFPKWDDIKMADSAWKYLDLGKTVTDWMNPPKQDDAPSELGTLLDTNKDNSIDSAELSTAPEEFSFGGQSYKKSDVESALRVIAKKTEGDFSVARKDYLAVQTHNWKNILQWPAMYIAFFFVLFIIFGKSPEDKTEEKQSEEPVKE